VVQGVAGRRARSLERDGRRWPIGDVLFDVGDVRIGFEICEDAWVANRPAPISRCAASICS
jgi:predicted amidohydrolase